MLRQVGGLFFYVLLFAIMLFVPAGTLDWPDAWILLATLLVVRGIIFALLWRSRRALMRARTFVPIPQPGQPLADRILLPIYMAAFAAQVAFTSLDARRLHLLPPTPEWLRFLGLGLFVVGWCVVYLALRENAFALTVVRLQDDRAQAVVDTGPYSVVRHPMYSGIVIVMIGLPLWFGSWAALIAAIVPVVLLALRIVIEERLLRERLAGYSQYVRQTRWRLLPGIW